MTDHSTSEEHALLASAYVDGELTADERARAEGDPLVMSMVEKFRDVRRQLAAPAPPDEARRDAAIVAALAAAPPNPSIAARRRARWMAPLAAAAAALVLVVGGVVALRAGDDDDGDQASLEVVGRDQLEDADAAAGAATLPSPVAPQDLATAATTAAGVESAEGEATEATEAPAAATVAEDQAAAEATTAASALVLITEDDLRAFAPVTAPDESGATPAELCRTGGRFLGVARVQLVDGIVDVEVYEVDAPAERVAVDRQTCEVVLRATP